MTPDEIICPGSTYRSIMVTEEQNINEQKYSQLFAAGAKGILAWLVMSFLFAVIGYLLATFLSDKGVTKEVADILTVMALIPVLGILHEGECYAAGFKREAAEDENVKTSFWFERGKGFLIGLAVVRVLGFFVRFYVETDIIANLSLTIILLVAETVLLIIVLIFICNGFIRNCKVADDRVSNGFKIIRIAFPVIILPVAVLPALKEYIGDTLFVVLNCVSLFLGLACLVVIFALVTGFMKQFDSKDNNDKLAFKHIKRYFIILLCLLVVFLVAITGFKIIGNVSVKNTAMEVFENNNSAGADIADINTLEDLRKNKGRDMSVGISASLCKDTGVFEVTRHLIPLLTTTENYIVNGDLVNEAFGYSVHYYLVTLDNGEKVLAFIPTCVFDRFENDPADDRINLYVGDMQELLWDKMYTGYKGIDLAEETGADKDLMLYYANVRHDEIKKAEKTANSLFAWAAKILMLAVIIPAAGLIIYNDRRFGKNPGYTQQAG